MRNLIVKSSDLEKQLEEVLSIHRDCQVEKLDNNSEVKGETCQKSWTVGQSYCWIETSEYPERRKEYIGKGKEY